MPPLPIFIHILRKEEIRWNQKLGSLTNATKTKQVLRQKDNQVLRISFLIKK